MVVYAEGRFVRTLNSLKYFELHENSSITFIAHTLRVEAE